MTRRLAVIRVFSRDVGDSARNALLRVQPGSVESCSPGCKSALRVFLDCNQCDTEFVMREVAFVDYVRGSTRR